MIYIAFIVVLLFVLWLALELKTSRPDGTYQLVHPYRRILTYIMKTRNESVVYFDEYVRAAELVRYSEEAKDKIDGGLTPCLVAAINVGLASQPRLNRFVSGNRVYTRNARWITFSMKRKKLDSAAKVSVVKLKMDDRETYAELVARINEKVAYERTDAKTYVDKELDLFGYIPRPVLRQAVKGFKWLDHYGLLPGSFIEGDGMYTSCFLANLGSLHMGAGYHHLYEWGNCPIFVMVGEVEDKVIAVDGEMVVEPILHIRFSFDERTDDGLTCRNGVRRMLQVLRNPYEELGCLKEDGSDAKPIWQPELEPKA